MCEFHFYLENKDKFKELISTQRQSCWDVKDMKERGNEKKSGRMEDRGGRKEGKGSWREDVMM